MSPSFLLRAGSALQEATQHVDDTGTRGTQVETFLAQHILVIMCAEMQQEIGRLIKTRIDELGSTEISNFTVASCGRLFRSVMTNEIAGLLGNFSAKCKESFNAQLGDRVVMQYNAAVKDRHAVAHKSGVQLTLSDAKAVLEDAAKVLYAASHALGEICLVKATPEGGPAISVPEVSES